MQPPLSPPPASGYPAPPPWSKRIRTVGVTGTNGKTSTVGWVAAALATVDEHSAHISTLGHWVGEMAVEAQPNFAGFCDVMRAAHEGGGRHAAIELTSMALGLGFMAGWPCNVGVFTNFSRDHLDIHQNAEHYLASKAQLFVHLPPTGTAVLNADEDACALLREVIPEGVRVWSYGRQGNLRLHIEDVAWTGTQLHIESPELGIDHHWRLRAVGGIYAYNASAALLAAVACGVPWRQAAAAIAAVAAPRGRFEVVAKAPYVVIDYAHTPAALTRTIEVARSLCPGELRLVIGAGGDRDATKRAAMGRAAAQADRCWITNDNPRQEDPHAIAEQVAQPLREKPSGHESFAIVLDRRRAIAQALETAKRNDVVLIAGKGHERVQLLGDQVHPFDDAQVVRELLA